MIKPIQDFDGFTPKQVAKLLILRTLWRWEQKGDLLGRVFEPDAVDDMFHSGIEQDILTDAINETRHQGEYAKGVNDWVHHSWIRHYDVNVHAFPLSNTKALAWNYVSGGGKYGNPETYPWYSEPRFVEITGTQTITIRTYEEIA